MIQKWNNNNKNFLKFFNLDTKVVSLNLKIMIFLFYREREKEENGSCTEVYQPYNYLYRTFFLFLYRYV